MSSFIDRNPELMMQYGNEARAVIGEMTLLIRKVEGVLDAYSADLDEPTQKQIQKLHEYSSAYFKQIETYQKVADHVYLKGKHLMDIRNGG